MSAADVLAAARASLNISLANETHVAHYRACHDYDGDGNLTVADVVNMRLNLRGTLLPHF